jgi:hypothetical protein
VPASRDVYRAVANGPSWTITQVDGLSPSLNEGHPVVSEDERTIFFSRAAAGGPATIWTATRADKSAAFSGVLPVSELHGNVDSGAESDDRPTWLSPDRCTLFFTSNRSGVYRAYSATRR